MITGFRNDRQKWTVQRKWLGYFLFFFLAVIILRGPFAATFASFFSAVARPLWATEYAVSGWWNGTAKYFSSKRELIQENQRLGDALDLATLEAYSHVRLHEENKTLKAALGRAGDRDLLLARVLATPGRSPYDTLIIDAGLDYDLTPGMHVLFDGDFYLGEVSKVMKKSSIVTLSSSYGNEFPVNIGSSSIPAIAKGDGGGNFRITLPKGAPVALGDLAEMPSYFARYAGVIEAILEKGGGSLQDLFMRLPININGLKWVYVDVKSQHVESL